MYNEDFYIDYDDDGDEDNGYCQKYDEDKIEYFDANGNPYYKYDSLDILANIFKQSK